MRFKIVTIPRSFSGLLASFVVAFMAIPFLHDNIAAMLVVRVFFIAALVFSLFMLSGQQRILMLAVILGLPNILISSMSHFDSSLYAQNVRLVFGCIFYFYVAAIMLIKIIKAREVDNEIIYFAICIYLVIGIAFSFIFILLELNHNGSFSGLPTIHGHVNLAEELASDFQSLFFYSYVTLTTLGYGNIAPTTTAGSAMASLEAIVGQMYIAILISQLVGMRIASPVTKKIKSNAVDKDTPLEAKISQE